MAENIDTNAISASVYLALRKDCMSLPTCFLEQGGVPKGKCGPKGNETRGFSQHTKLSDALNFND